MYELLTQKLLQPTIIYGNRRYSGGGMVQQYHHSPFTTTPLTIYTPGEPLDFGRPSINSERAVKFNSI